ncbi:MAG: DUF4380 domain-containing protein [Planctomycetes bacterium]|nr:DUF4380 domain-containing protein [Planctomycetota bacterium]
MPEFLGLPCVELKNEALSMLITTTVGPRILSLRIRGGENLFAEVPDMTLDCPGAGKFHFWGGHRFWVAPEVPEITYLPDDLPVLVEPIPGGFVMTAPAQRAGIQKVMQVTLAPESNSSEAVVFVNHVLTNTGTQALTCAPWAITQFKPGGSALLHPSRIPGDEAGLQADRRFSLWPYTDIRSPFIEWGNDCTVVHARMKSGSLKIGFETGVQRYFRDGTVFSKSIHPLTAERGSSCECYCNDRFLELETLAPSSTLQPGESASHREVWTVRTGVAIDDVMPPQGAR